MKRLLFVIPTVALAAGCSPDSNTEEKAGPVQTEAVVVEAEAAVVETEKAFESRPIVTTSRDDWGSVGLDLASRKPSVEAGNNFYEHVNGAWIDTIEMPADRSRYNSFTLLAEKSEQRVRNIIDELAAAAPAETTLEGKVAAVYNAYMNTDAIEAAGLSEVKPYLNTIASISSYDDLANAFGSVAFTSPVGGFVDLDAKHPDTYIFQVSQSGLGLGDRSYYLDDNERNVELRAAYHKYLSILLTEAGYDNVNEAADKVLALETLIAAEHWDRTVGRNRNITYNKVTRDELVEMGSSFPVMLMLKRIGVDNQSEFIVRQVTPTAEEISENGLTEEQLAKIGGGVAGLFRVAAETDLDTWKAYLTAHFLSDNSNVLPAVIDEANFELYGRTLRGQEEQRERWKRGVGVVEGALGEGVGKVYAGRHFPAENKAAMDALVENLRRAMSENLGDIDWMGDDTKVEARDKLAKFTPKVGFTERFETYESLTVSADSAFGNSMATREWRFKDNISKLGQPIDKTEWFMLPQTVNAYYSSTRNEIVFPAAILQPPFFNLSADDAVNYGAIGGVIGHEMGHGFDDQGSKSDGNGVQRNWWTDEDSAAFKKLTDALVAQYNDFCPLDDGSTCVNGGLTLGENIGDLGGLSMAYRAYKISLNGEAAPVIDGLTGDQRFFMAWAQVWRNKSREEALRQQIISDPHSPARYRVNGVVRNFDEWYTAFDVNEDHELYLPPEERIRIW